MSRTLARVGIAATCLLIVLTSLMTLEKLTAAENQKERLVLLPVQGENLPQNELDLYQDAIKEGFSGQYEIFSGEQVQAKLQKFAINSCTSDECLEKIAIAFNGHLVGRGFVERDGKDSFLRIQIKDVFTDKDVYTKTYSCTGCSKADIMKKLKALTGGGSVSALAPGAVEFASSAAPDKGPTEGAVSRITPKVSGDSGSTVAALFLDSEPSGAAVYLGDIVAGETPYQNMGLKAGQTLRIVLKKDDYHPQTIELKLSGGSNEIDTVKLKPRFGSLSVTSEPAGAEVFLAGKKVGATPYKNAKVLSGTYLLSVRKDLYAPVENQTIQIVDEKATVKNVALQADFGTLEVASTPPGARAEVTRKSGKTVYKENTPFSVRLSPGTYEVSLEKDGYDSVSYTVTVNRNGKQIIDAASAVLRRLEGTVIVSSDPYEKGAEVRVDGELKGQVPATLIVPAGEHEIAVKGKKLQGKQKVIVKDSATVAAQIEMKEDKKEMIANSMIDSKMKSEIWAAVIGINDYKSNDIPDLNYAVSDAQAMVDYLDKRMNVPKDHIFYLDNEKATKQNVERLLGDTLPQRAKPRDTVIIYYSGHGASYPDKSSSDGDNVSKYLLTSDTEPSSMWSTAVAMDNLRTIFSRLPSERVIFLADTCFSGASSGKTFAVNTRAVLSDNFLERMATGRGRMIITASGVGELAREDKQLDGGHGVFTYYLLEGLKGAADSDKDGLITAGEAYAYVSRKVSDYTKNEQHPVKKGEEDWPLILGIVR